MYVFEKYKKKLKEENMSKEIRLNRYITLFIIICKYGFCSSSLNAEEKYLDTLVLFNLLIKRTIIMFNL